MLHHLSLGVSDLARSTAFYDAALAELGYVRVWTDVRGAGYASPGEEDKLAIKLRPDVVVAQDSGFHVALSAPSRDAVQRFYAQALRHGGTDNGGPGLRPNYGEHYYAAFVLDPDGNQLEAVIVAAA
jgi:catechol 2,3-dioxygenase-like lactoylglutathione lyase family enzyme